MADADITRLQEKMEALTQELHQFKRQHRWQRWAMLGIGMLVGGGLLRAGIHAQPSPTSPVMRTERLELLNQAGEVCAVLGVDDRDHPALTFSGTRVWRPGRRAARTSSAVQGIVGVLPDGGTGWSFRDADGQERSYFRVDQDGASCLTFRDRAGKDRAILSTTAWGTPSLTLQEGDRQSGITLGSGVNGSSHLTLRDQSGLERARLTLSVDGPSLELRGEDRRTRLGLMVSARGTSEVSLQGPDGRSKAFFEIAPEGTPSFVLWDKSGEASVQFAIDSTSSPRFSLRSIDGSAGIAMGFIGLSPFIYLSNQAKTIWRVP